MKLIDIDQDGVTVHLDLTDCRLLSFACEAAWNGGRTAHEQARDAALGTLAALFDAAGMAHDICGETSGFSLGRYRDNPEHYAPAV